MALQLLLLLCGYIGVFAQMLLLADAMHAAMAAAYAASPANWRYYDIDQVQRPSRGHHVYVALPAHALRGQSGGPGPRRRLLAFMALEMWCRFTLMGQRQLDELEFLDYDEHVDQMAATSNLTAIASSPPTCAATPASRSPWLFCSRSPPRSPRPTATTSTS